MDSEWERVLEYDTPQVDLLQCDSVHKCVLHTLRLSPVYIRFSNVPFWPGTES